MEDVLETWGESAVEISWYGSDLIPYNRLEVPVSIGSHVFNPIVPVLDHFVVFMDMT